MLKKLLLSFAFISILGSAPLVVNAEESQKESLANKSEEQFKDVELAAKLDAMKHQDLEIYLDKLLEIEAPSEIDEDTLKIAVEVSLRYTSLFESGFVDADIDVLKEDIANSNYSKETKEILLNDTLEGYGTVEVDVSIDDFPIGTMFIITIAGMTLFFVIAISKGNGIVF